MAKFSDYFKEIETILISDDTDQHVIYKVLFDDNGQCIHITFTGSTSIETIYNIGKYFKDSTPIIEADKNKLKVIVSNNLDD